VRAAVRGAEDIMPNIGFSELIVILLILVLVFGASRLPALGEAVGRTIRSFKRGIAQDENIEISHGGHDGTAESRPKATQGTQAAKPSEPKHIGSSNNANANIVDAEIIEDEKS
jgi:sec-independent protein translocase protein TatA